MIGGDSCMVYVACPLRPTRLRLALFSTTVLQRPAPRFRPSSLRSPMAPLWSLQTSQLESHELDEYCTTPFYNGAFRVTLHESHTGHWRFSAKPVNSTGSALLSLFIFSGFRTYCPSVKVFTKAFMVRNR